VHLSGQANINRQHGRSAVYWAVAFTSGQAPIDGRVLRENLRVPAGGYYKSGSMGVYLHFGESGGCGSTSTKTATTPATTSTTVSKPAPTRAQFIAQADEICKTAHAKIAPLKARAEALRGQSQNSSTYKNLASLLREDVAISRAVQKNLQALPQPPADTATIEKMLAGFSEEITDKNNAADAVAHEEISGIQAANTADKKANAFDEGLAQGYGMKFCGKSE